jgi:hypothetical protein
MLPEGSTVFDVGASDGVLARAVMGATARRERAGHRRSVSGLSVEVWRQRLALYPPIASAFFNRSLHGIARLRPR